MIKKPRHWPGGDQILHFSRQSLWSGTGALKVTSVIAVTLKRNFHLETPGCSSYCDLPKSPEYFSLRRLFPHHCEDSTPFQGNNHHLIIIMLETMYFDTFVSIDLELLCKFLAPWSISRAWSLLFRSSWTWLTILVNFSVMIIPEDWQKWYFFMNKMMIILILLGVLHFCLRWFAGWPLENNYK